MEKSASRLPVHEAIANLIKRCNPSPSKGEILNIMKMIAETEILTGHDDIIKAIDNYYDFPGSSKWAKEIHAVKKSLTEQKEAVEKKSSEKIKLLDLNELNVAVKNLSSFLDTPEPNPVDMEWAEQLLNHIDYLHLLTT